jgi:hypothetical protein
MITKFKIYESLNNNKPKIGNYVLIKSHSDMFKKYEDKIGKIVDLESDKQNYKDIMYYINFYIDEINDHIGKRREPIYGYEIKYWSDDKEDIKRLLDIKKYNL